MTSQSARQSLLMSVASRLPALVEQAEELEAMLNKMRDAQTRGRVEEDICRRVERWSESATNSLDAAEKLIASEPAQTLAEAAVQLMLAVSRAQVLAISSMTAEEREATSAELERLLQSAMPVVAGAAGIDLTDYARAYYADRRTDPFYRGSSADKSSTVQESFELGSESTRHDPFARLRAAGFGV